MIWFLFIYLYIQIILLLLFAVFSFSYCYYGDGGGYGGYSGNVGSLPIIRSHQSLNYYPVASSNYGYAQPTTVYTDSIGPPVNIVSRSFSSPVTLQHIHIPSPGSFRATSSQDGAHVRVHTVTKPIIQEVREIIAPQRIIRQQVLPVQEEIQTLVARNIVSNNNVFQ